MALGSSGIALKKKCARKNASGNRSDIGWEHGFEVDGTSRKNKCKYCSKEVIGGTFRFKHHLAGTKNNIGPCLSVPENVKQKIIEVLINQSEHSNKKQRFNSGDGGSYDSDEEVVPGKEKVVGKKHTIDSLFRRSKSTQLTINQMLKPDLEEEVHQLAAKFFYTSAIPFNCVKNPYFIQMCEAIGKYGIGYKPPSYHQIRETYLKKVVSHTNELLEEHKKEWTRTGCTIMSDGWSDKKRRSIVNFLVNSPMGTVFLSSIDASEISKTAEKVCEMLDDIVEKVGEENVVQIVTDNAANYKAAREILTEKRKTLFWTPCAAHCIDLMLEDFEKKLEIHRATIYKGKKVTIFIYSRTLLISLMKQFTKGRDLIRPAATRFATSYLTLGCFNEFKGALVSMFSSTKWRHSRYSKMRDGKFVEKVVLDKIFWQNITTRLKAAYPLIKVLRLVDSDEKPAMPFIYEEMDRCKENIQENFKNVKKSYEPIWKIIDDRWASQLHRPLHAAAYFLNPQLRFDPNPENNYKVGMEVKRGLYDCLERMVLNQNERNKIDSQTDLFKARKRSFGSTQARNMWNKKSPADWWDSYGDDCLELQRFAIRILSLTCSSSGCEHNWSAFEMVHTKMRNRLHQKKMNDLVFVMCNLKLKDKQVRKQVELDDISSDDEWLADSQTNEESIDLESEDDMEDDFVEDDKEDELEKHDSLESTFIDDEDDEENQDIDTEENDDMEDDL